MGQKFDEILKLAPHLHVQQIWEPLEMVTGFESRNKYRIFDDKMNPIAYAAEASSGFWGVISRLFLKHWRSFEIHIFNNDRKLLYKAKFPFRWFFKTLYLETPDGQPLGSLQQRFAFFYKKFDLIDQQGMLLAKVRSPFFKFWTFEFESRNSKIASVQKKWSGGFSEIFTDKDNFIVSFHNPNLSLETKSLIMTACLMIDVVYFENNQGSKSMIDILD